MNISATIYIAPCDQIMRPREKQATTICSGQRHQVERKQVRRVAHIARCEWTGELVRSLPNQAAAAGRPKGVAHRAPPPPYAPICKRGSHLARGVMILPARLLGGVPLGGVPLGGIPYLAAYLTWRRA